MEVQGEMNYIELKRKFNITSIDEAFGCLFSTKLNRHERLEILRELKWSYRYMRNSMFRIMKDAVNKEEIIKHLLDHESIPKELLDKRDKFVFKRLTRYEFIEAFPYFEAKRQLNDEAKLDVLNYFIKLFHHVNHPTLYRWFPQGHFPYNEENARFYEQYLDLTRYHLEIVLYGKLLDMDDYDKSINDRYCRATELASDITGNQIIKQIDQSIREYAVEHYNEVLSDFKAGKNVEYTNAFDLFIHEYLINNPDEKITHQFIHEIMDEILQLTKIPKPTFHSPFKVFSGKIGLIRILRNNIHNAHNYLPLTLKNETPSTLGCCWEIDEEEDEEETKCDFSDPDEELCLCTDDPHRKLVWSMSYEMGKKTLNPYIIQSFRDISIDLPGRVIHDIDSLIESFKYAEKEGDSSNDYTWLYRTGEINYSFPFFYGDEYLFKLLDNDEEKIKKFLYEEMYRRIHDKLKCFE